MDWSWEVQNCKIPAGEHCSCGIYVASDMAGAAHYFSHECVFAKIALWGNVTVADHGARGQYAYPQELVIPPYLAEAGERVAAIYQVPFRILNAEDDLDVGVAIRTVTKKKDPQLAAETRGAGFVLLSLTTFCSLVSLVIQSSWGLIPLFFAIGCLLLACLAFVDAHRYG